MAGQLHIRAQTQRGRRQELKCGRGQRTLRLRPWLVHLLRAHRARQHVTRLLAGEKWHDQNLVFPGRYGKPQWSGPVHARWKATLAAAGLRDARFHHLRHTAASLLLAEGASLFEVSRTLGRATPGTTANIYGHLSDEAGRASAGRRLTRGARALLRTPTALCHRLRPVRYSDFSGRWAPAVTSSGDGGRTLQPLMGPGDDVFRG